MSLSALTTWGHVASALPDVRAGGRIVVLDDFSQGLDAWNTEDAKLRIVNDELSDRPCLWMTAAQWQQECERFAALFDVDRSKRLVAADAWVDQPVEPHPPYDAPTGPRWRFAGSETKRFSPRRSAASATARRG